MKKYLILLSAIAATAAFAEKGSADKENPTAMSTWSSFGGGTTAGEVIWNGNGGNTTTDMTDSYVIADKDFTLQRFKISGTGGDHCNLNLDLNGKTLTFTNDLVDYNDTTYGNGLKSSYALGINITNSDSANEATMNFTSSRVEIKLETTDAASGGADIRNKYGRTVYIGEGITANIKTFDVSGRFKNLSDPSKMKWDSKMTVAGKVNVANTMTLRDTNFENTGTVSANVINVYGSNFTSSGSLLSDGLSAYENSNIVLGGSNLAKDGTSQGTVRFYGKNNTLTASSDLAAQYLVLKNTTTFGETTYEAAELTIKGDFTTDKIVMEDNTQLTIDSGAKTTFDFSNKKLDGSAMSIKGDITVKGMLDIKTKGGGHATESVSYRNILVDGGNLINTTTLNSTYSFNIYEGKTITLKNGGTINTSTNSFIGLTGGKLIVDATSKILANQIMFAQSRGTLELSHASNLASNTHICVKDRSANADAKIVLTDCGEAYFIKNLRPLRKSQLSIDLNGAELHIANVAAYQPDAKGTDFALTFLDFENGLVKVDGWTTELISSGEFEISAGDKITLVAYDKAGKLLDGLWSVDASGYLANSAIPEPAEWAAIFGAIALGLAVYRRRK